MAAELQSGTESNMPIVEKTLKAQESNRKESRIESPTRQGESGAGNRGSRRRFQVGDWVEVRSKDEILRTLDSDGRLEGMPFMPEMFEFCGRQFQVFKRAHKTCDPDYRSRRVPNAVHLQTRCDGHAHGGCQAGCLIFWKEAWLRPARGAKPVQTGSPHKSSSELINIATDRGCTESVVRERTQLRDRDGAGVSYTCQTTWVQHEKLLAWWDIRQYIEDYTSGNITLGRLISGAIYSMYFNLSQAGIGLGPAMRKFYEVARPLWHGIPWPRAVGSIPDGDPTPAAALNLQPGELVRVKPVEQILQTVTTASKNRGMYWDAELVPYCGGTYKVIARVTNVLDEKTGKMLVMKTPGILLDTVVCQARYSACRMFCPRNTYAYWREIWLERISPPVPDNEKARLPSPPVNAKGGVD